MSTTPTEPTPDPLGLAAQVKHFAAANVRLAAELEQARAENVRLRQQGERAERERDEAREWNNDARRQLAAQSAEVAVMRDENARLRQQGDEALAMLKRLDDGLTERGFGSLDLGRDPVDSTFDAILALVGRAAEWQDMADKNRAERDEARARVSELARQNARLIAAHDADDPSDAATDATPKGWPTLEDWARLAVAAETAKFELAGRVCDLKAALGDLRYNLALRAFCAPDMDTAAMFDSLDARLRDSSQRVRDLEQLLGQSESLDAVALAALRAGVQQLAQQIDPQTYAPIGQPFVDIAARLRALLAVDTTPATDGDSR